jgi:hypothetical protein
VLRAPPVGHVQGGCVGRQRPQQRLGGRSVVREPVAKNAHVEPRLGRQTLVSVCRRSTQAEPPYQNLTGTSHQSRRYVAKLPPREETVLPPPSTVTEVRGGIQWIRRREALAQYQDAVDSCHAARFSAMSTRTKNPETPAPLASSPARGPHCGAETGRSGGLYRHAILPT